MAQPSTPDPIVDLQVRLEAAANARTRRFWNTYLKGAIEFHGVPMGAIRRELHAWWRAHALSELRLRDQKALALALLRGPVAEDKLAGTLLCQDFLLPRLATRDLPAFARLFDEGHIADWNTCDWFCVKVLGPLVASADDPEPVARAIGAWRRSRSLWQRRAAGVAFVNLAKQGDALFPGFVDLLLEVCDATVRSPDRFAQTGVGWVLRELSLADRAAVEAFVHRHAERMSSEAVRYAVAKIPPSAAGRLIAWHREVRRAARSS